MAQQPFTPNETFFDSEELMSWLLLNPDIADLDPIGQSSSLAGPATESMFSLGSYGTIHPNGIMFDQQHQMQGSSSGDAGNIVINGINDKQAETKPKRKYTRENTNNDSGGDNSKKKRKKESIEDLEARVNELQSENADLQAHLFNVTQRTTEVQKQRVAMESLMVQKLTELSSRTELDQSELSKLVNQYTDLYADYGKCRQREVSFHLNQLEKLIVPTKTTKMCLWTLHQDQSFYQTSQSPMYDILSKELDITPEQTRKIQQRRERIIKLLEQLRESLRLIENLKVAIEKKHASYDSICGRVQEATTPKQTVQFLIWIAKNVERLAKYIPSFSRNVHHIPNIQFVEDVSSDASKQL